MKKVVILSCFAIMVSGIAYAGGKCSGSKNCNACKKCKYCKYCSGGKKCGKCN